MNGSEYIYVLSFVDLRFLNEVPRIQMSNPAMKGNQMLTFETDNKIINDMKVRP
jgi:hypothetical protein